MVVEFKTMFTSGNKEAKRFIEYTDEINCKGKDFTSVYSMPISIRTRMSLQYGSMRAPPANKAPH